MKKSLYILTLLFSVLGFSQTLYSGLEKKTIALGEPNVFKIRIDNLDGKEIGIAPKNELLPFHFEEISDSTFFKNNTFERTVKFTVFEEGKFTIPALEVKIDGEIYQTIPYELDVVNTAQEGDKINDIMNNKSVRMGLVDYWDVYKFYVLVVLVFFALIFVIWQIIKYSRKKKSSLVLTTNETLKKLHQLKNKKYIEKGNCRSFYVELIDISRQFITNQYGIPADVLLTDDLIHLMKKNQTISLENEKIIEDIFLRGDMVKFAKTFPNQETMKNDFEAIKTFVKRSPTDLEFEKLRRDV